VIAFDKVKVGDKLKIVGAGAPGFAKLGDIVTVTREDRFDTIGKAHGISDAAIDAVRRQSAVDAETELRRRARNLTKDGTTIEVRTR
jgi:hypothetical protein